MMGLKIGFFDRWFLGRTDPDEIVDNGEIVEAVEEQTKPEKTEEE